MWRNTFNLADFLRDSGIVRREAPPPISDPLQMADLLASLLEVLDRMGADVAAAHLSQAVETLREQFHTPN
ncbi:hypothetical protein OKA06_12870 [Novosphingobium sp. MW5]|nr:hypothetical protein [Novosphingobium sp. MW5]